MNYLPSLLLSATNHPNLPMSWQASLLTLDVASMDVYIEFVYFIPRVINVHRDNYISEMLADLIIGG